MGFRTIVLFNNDKAHLWENDPKLGQKILQAGRSLDADLEVIDTGAQVVACTPTYDECDSLFFVNHLHMSRVTHVPVFLRPSLVRKLEEIAAWLGYDLVPRKKAK